MSEGEYRDDCLYCWGDPRTELTLLSGHLVVNHEQVRFEASNLTLVWPRVRILGAAYAPTHPIDIDSAAGGNIDAAQDIAIGLAMDVEPDPAISILIDDPEDIVEGGFDIRIVFDTEYRAKLAMKRIESATGTRYSSSKVVQVAKCSDEPAGGWSRVDRSLRSLKSQLRNAQTEEQWQAVGLHCREILISLAQAVFDPEVHRLTDGVEPSKTDGGRMLQAYLLTELDGKSNEAARRYAKAALTLANDLQHRRTATEKDARMCFEATVSVVNIVAIVSGHRTSD